MQPKGGRLLSLAGAADGSVEQGNGDSVGWRGLARAGVGAGVGVVLVYVALLS